MDFLQTLAKLQEQEIEVEYTIPKSKEAIADRVLSPLMKQQMQRNKNNITATVASEKTGTQKGKKVRVKFKNQQEKDAYEAKMGIK